MVTPPSLLTDWMEEWSSVSLWLLPYPRMSTSSDSDVEDIDEEEDVVESEELSDTERLLLQVSCMSRCVMREPRPSSLRRKKRCSRYRWSLWADCFFSRSSRFFIKCFALVSSPSVVCLEPSGPRGTISFNFSKHVRRCARLFFSNSLCVVRLFCSFDFDRCLFEIFE